MPRPIPNPVRPVAGIGEPHGQPDVVRQQKQKDDSRIREVTMHVLEQQRERALAPVARAARLTDRAGGRVRPEAFVIRAAIVITGEAEECGERQDDERWREWQERGPPFRLRAEPGMRRIAPQHRCIEWREIRPVLVVRVLKRSPRGIHQEAAEHAEHQQRIPPPRIAPLGLTKSARHDLDWNDLHPTASDEKNEGCQDALRASMPSAEAGIAGNQPGTSFRILRSGCRSLQQPVSP